MYNNNENKIDSIAPIKYIEIPVSLFSEEHYFERKIIENYKDKIILSFINPVLAYKWLNFSFDWNIQKVYVVFYYDITMNLPSSALVNFTRIKVLLYNLKNIHSVLYFTKPFKDFFKSKLSYQLDSFQNRNDFFIFVNCQLSKSISTCKIKLVEKEINDLERILVDLNIDVKHFSGDINDIQFTDNIISEIIKFIAEKDIKKEFFEKIVCKECGTVRVDDYLFCSNCGSKLN